MITCTCNGRLGNHLFQIAHLISVAKSSNTDFVVPLQEKQVIEEIYL